MKNDEEDKFPTQQQRLELRLGTLRLARTFPPDLSRISFDQLLERWHFSKKKQKLYWTRSHLREPIL